MQIREVFGLASVRVGKWVTSDESQKAANLIFDALADLAFILNVPPSTLGLRRNLNLDFGIGGRQGVQAHYAPQTKTLALAKNAGAGALAHEFWHALDHHLAASAFDNDGLAQNRIEFASQLWLDNRALRPHPLNKYLEQLFQIVFLNAYGDEPNQFVKNAVALDKSINRYYFAMPTEIAARAFEAAIESESSINNQYLVSGTYAKDEQTLKAYPEDPHRKSVLYALQHYFQCLANYL